MASKHIKDPFSYSARWDSVGLDCSFCKHFIGPETWPDEKRVSRCGYHNVSLAFQLREGNFKGGEWFCKHFLDNGRAFPRAVREFKTIEADLEEDIVYGAYGEKGQLKEHKISV